MSKCWQDGDLMVFKHPATQLPTYGWVRGYATIDVGSGVGRGLIVEVEDKFDFNGGKFNHLIVMECWVLP